MKNKALKVTIISLVCCIGLLFLFYDKAGEYLKSPAALSCTAGGGVYKMLGSGCSGRCPREDGEIWICGQIQAMGCDCGENSCWNGTSCEPD